MSASAGGEGERMRMVLDGGHLFFSEFFLGVNPTTNGCMQNGISVRICYVLHARFCTFGADFYARTVAH